MPTSPLPEESRYSGCRRGTGLGGKVRTRVCALLGLPWVLKVGPPTDMHIDPQLHLGQQEALS